MCLALLLIIVMKFVCAIACIRILFLLIVNYILFCKNTTFCSFVDVYLCCFQVLATGTWNVHNAAMNIHVQIFVGTYIFISVGIAGSYRNSF